MAKRLLLLAEAASQHTRRWASEFAHRGYEVHVATLRPGDIPGVQVHGLHPSSLGKLGYLAVFAELRRLVKRLRPDLVHAHYATSYGLLGTFTGFHPFVVSVWGSDVYDFPERSPLHRALLARNLRLADAITSTSHDMARVTARYAPGRCIQVIPFGVELSQYRVATPPEVPTIGCLKALEPWYGQEYLLKAVRLLLDRKPDRPLRVLLAGDGSDRQRLEQLCQTLGLSDRVEFLGKLPLGSAPKFLARLSVLAMPSLSESFGVVAVEASASGLPVVASRVGGVPEVVRDGETGFLVEPRNPAQLADVLERLMSDPALCARMGAAGREYVGREYDWRLNADRMEAVYQAVMADRCAFYS